MFASWSRSKVGKDTDLLIDETLTSLLAAVRGEQFAIIMLDAGPINRSQKFVIDFLEETIESGVFVLLEIILHHEGDSRDRADRGFGNVKTGAVSTDAYGVHDIARNIERLSNTGRAKALVFDPLSASRYGDYYEAKHVGLSSQSLSISGPLGRYQHFVAARSDALKMLESLPDLPQGKTKMTKEQLIERWKPYLSGHDGVVGCRTRTPYAKVEFIRVRRAKPNHSPMRQRFDETTPCPVSRANIMADGWNGESNAAKLSSRALSQERLQASAWALPQKLMGQRNTVAMTWQDDALPPEWWVKHYMGLNPAFLGRTMMEGWQARGTADAIMSIARDMLDGLLPSVSICPPLSTHTCLTEPSPIYAPCPSSSNRPPSEPPAAPFCSQGAGVTKLLRPNFGSPSSRVYTSDVWGAIYELNGKHIKQPAGATAEAIAFADKYAERRRQAEAEYQASDEAIAIKDAVKLVLVLALLLPICYR